MTDIVGIIKSGGGVRATVSPPTRVIGTVANPPNNSNDVRFKRFIISPPTLQFTVTHNMNTTQFIESIKDQDGRKVFAFIEIVDNNSFIIKFTTATIGTVDVLFGFG